MLITALILLTVAIAVAVLGVLATWDQGVSPIMYWSAVASLAAALGLLLGHIAQNDDL